MSTPRTYATPCSRYEGKTKSPGASAQPLPTWAASWPRQGAQIPSWPWRCRLVPSVSIRRTTTSFTYRSRNSSSATSRTCASLWSMSRHSRVESASGGVPAPDLWRPGCGRRGWLPVTGAGLVRAPRQGPDKATAPTADAADGDGRRCPARSYPTGTGLARGEGPARLNHAARKGQWHVIRAILAGGTGLPYTRAGTSVGSGPCGCRPGGGGAIQSPSASTPSVACGDDGCTLLQSFSARHQGICGDGGGWLL